jgi:beta-glucosidase
MNQTEVPTFEERADALVAAMTLEEKILQMVYDAPAIERLGIPAYNWWNEALHGVGRAGVATVFPQAIGLAATWNPDLIGQVADVISDEARAKHHETVRRGIRQIYTGLTVWSPNINIFRDPRWGRGQETYGEDPYLTAQMGVAFVKGLQGDDPCYLKLVATPKHYAVHSGPEPDRHHFDAQIDEPSMRDFYLFAFEACVKEAKAASMMGAYNRINGEPACASPTLLQKILRDEWGFDGYVVSDCEAIRDIFAHHKVVATAAEAAALAVKTGCDLNCGRVYAALLDAVEQGLIDEADIDRAVRRLLVMRFRLGMFDLPEQMPYTDIPYAIIRAPEHRALAREAARESIVLLKNDGDLLPLPKDIGSIAVIGPNADSLPVLLGNYNGTPDEAVTPLEGIREAVGPETVVYYAPGCEIAPGVPPYEAIPSTCLRPLAPAGGETGLDAAYYDGDGLTDAPAVRRVDRQVDFVWKDSSPLDGDWGKPFGAAWEGYLVPPVSGTYRLGVNGHGDYALYLDDKRIVHSDVIHHPILTTRSVDLEAGRLYRLRLEVVNLGLDPQIQLLWATPDADYETSALRAARQADVIVMVMGLSPELEAEEKDVQVEGFAGGDRTDIELPSTQRALLKKVHALGKPVVLVLLSGSALAVNWADAHIPAIVEAWYPGQMGGRAIADVLFGDVNPAGRLPVTFYRSVDDLPPFDDYDLEGHTYRYFRGDPLYAFGYGLSYTTFTYGDLNIEPSEVAPGEVVMIRVAVTNSGERAGDEVVQLYTRRPDAGEGAPNKELRAFARVSLDAGERKTVTFTLHTHQLGRYDEAAQYVIPAGVVEVMVGGASDQLPVRGEFAISEMKIVEGKDKVFFSGAQVT